MSRAIRLFLPVLFLLLLCSPALADDEPDVDNDGDGFTDNDGDCDDEDAAIHPDALEICDLVDNDCDVDVDAADADYVGEDADNDGDLSDLCGGSDCDDLDPEVDGLDADGDGISLCSPVPDCDDNDPLASPGNDEEICGDGIDNDCTGAPDDLDLDGDGAVSPDCAGDDCDDGNASINPEAGESGTSCIDQIDNDCDCTGDTNGDGTVCGLGDEGVDGLDDDCFTAPIPDAGEVQQDRYLGGVAVIVLDGSATTDDNSDDVLTYTWTVTPREDYSGIDWTLDGDASAPYGYLRFQAAPEAEGTEWVFDATLVVSDGIHTTDVEDENASVTATFFRPTFLSRIGCSAVGSAGVGLLALGLALIGLVGLRRRA
jgi:hypothetical protein